MSHLGLNVLSTLHGMSRYLGYPLLGGVTVEGYQQVALRKQPTIAPFKERFKTISLRKCKLVNFISTYIDLLTIVFLLTFLGRRL